MLLTEMKTIIKYVIELDINYLETFLGYEGDNVLKIVTENANTLKQIKSFLDNLGLEYKSDYQIYGRHVGSHILFVGVEDENIFKLKRDETKR